MAQEPVMRFEFEDRVMDVAPSDFDKIEVFEGQSGNWGVLLKLNKAGADVFEDATRDNIGKRVKLLICGKFISDPIIRTEITQGPGQMSFGEDEAGAKSVAATLKSGDCSKLDASSFAQ